MHNIENAKVAALPDTSRFSAGAKGGPSERNRIMTRSFYFAIFIVLTVVLSAGARAQDAAFRQGWTLDADASSIQFQSIKNQAVIETSSFATYTGTISPEGEVVLTIQLDSVDTKVDLRNVRMRFLFFETFEHPEATIFSRIDPASIAELETARRLTVTQPFAMKLHGQTKTLEAPLVVTLIGTDLVSVATAEPIMLSVADFDLMGGLEKLEEAAGVTIVPSTTVSFDLIFKRNGTGQAPVVQAAATGAAAALETTGEFTTEACIGRFEILSRTGNIYFRPGSARLSEESAPLLTQVADIIRRCPDLRVQVSGHTDAIGSAASNQRLSERRAGSVVSYLRDRGIEAGRMRSVGYDESRPMGGNDTDKGRSRYRRIEFTALGS